MNRMGKERLIDAQKIWFAILNSQIETGTPYLLYKDACNAKSNQNNLGTIKSSNLCTEIIEYSNEEETAVCNLGSIFTKLFRKKWIQVATFSNNLYETGVLLL